MTNKKEEDQITHISMEEAITTMQQLCDMGK